MTGNIFRDNEHLDISVQEPAAGTTGGDNTCDTTSNYDDDGTPECTFSCAEYPKGDLDHNGVVTDAVDVAMMIQASVGDIIL